MVSVRHIVLVGAIVGGLYTTVSCSRSNTVFSENDESSLRTRGSSDLLVQFCVSEEELETVEDLTVDYVECLDPDSGCEYVEIGGDRRRAIRISPGSTRQAVVTMPRYARLRFSFASQGADSQIDVTVSTDNGRSLARTFIVPKRRLWHDTEISLEGFEGAECEISASAGDGGGVILAMPRIVTFPPTDPGRDRKNVLFYLIDTLRADHVSAYGYERLTTPFLDGLGKRGYVYLNSYSTSAWTRPSTASLLTGLYPSFHQANARMRLPLEVETIAEILRAGGWSTWAFITNANVNAAGLDFEQGFDRFVAIKGPGGHPNADQINALVVPWLDEVGDEPFFLFLHSVDPHAPYDPPESVRHRFTSPDYRGPVIPNETRKKDLAGREPTEADLVHIRGLYDEEILFQDEMIRELFGFLESKSLTEITYSIITSDHGEEFYEHGYWEHGKKLFEEQIRVPLIVVPPKTIDVESAAVVSPVQGVDLAPTILGWLGVESLGSTSQGVPLPTSNALAPRSRPVYCEEIRVDSGFELFSLKDDSLKMITKTNRERGGRKTWLFDLAEDPLEQVNLFSAADKMHQDLLQRLTGFPTLELSGEPCRAVLEPKFETDALDQLRALGYIE